MEIVTRESLKQIFLPLPKDINKSHLGRLIIVGGSKNYVGAIILSSLAAMRTGLGTSMIAVPKSIASDVRRDIIFSGVEPLSEDNGNIKFNQSEFEEISKGATAFAVGMGMSKGEGAKIVDFLIKGTSLNFVLDADGLKNLGKNAKEYDFRAVFTPHPKEFAYLTGLSVGEILNNPIEIAKNYAMEHKVILLLKGHNTIITDGLNVQINEVGAPKMAKGGSGDVLSGVIGALLARGIKPFDAARAGAYLCGRSAQLCSVNEYSYLPTDTIENLIKAIDEIINLN